MPELTKRDIASKLELYNQSTEAYELLCLIFTPFDNNLRSSTLMELFASAIESVRSTIQAFKESGHLPPGLTHIPGLNDQNSHGLFYLLNGVGSLSDRLMSAIGFSQDDIRTLQQILLIIEQNKLNEMQQDMQRWGDR